MSNKKVYIAGDMLKKGSILLREKEKSDLEAIGVKTYSPIDDKEINDKINQSEKSNSSLAEKIVYKDTKGILQNDIVIIEPTNDAMGTMVELGQLKGMKDASNLIMNILNQDLDETTALIKIYKLAQSLNKKVYPHYEDIRRTNIPECSDRRSWGVNQYVYGVCLDLSDGKGFYEWEEILNELKD